MRTPWTVVRAAVAARRPGAALTASARAAEPAAPGSTLTREEYERKIQELEDAIKELRKDTRQLQVADEEASEAEADRRLATTASSSSRRTATTSSTSAATCTSTAATSCNDSDTRRRRSSSSAAPAST